MWTCSKFDAMRNLNIGLIVLSSPEIKGVGPSFIRKNIVKSDFFEEDVFLSIKELLLKNKKDIPDEVLENTIELAKIVIEKCDKNKINILSIFDDQYPRKLKEIKDAPAILYTKGNIQIIENQTICVIGTRKPNMNGERIAQRVSNHYQSKSWNICNGLADGIDQAAIHFGEQYYPNVIGVLGGGLNFNERSTILKSTAKQANQIFESGGLLVSEYPPDKKEDTFSVVKSCRIQAGLSDGLFLIQSSIDGGSKFTITSFTELKRPIAVVNPLKEDIDLIEYSGNRLIIDQSLDGLSIISKIKKDKIQTKDVIVISSKEDYQSFDSLITNDGNVEEVNYSLF
jgi:DNA processing protein